MDREQVKEIFKLLKYSYPNFEVNSDKIDTWTRLLKDQNPAVVMRNTERYVLEQKFPPTISELRERRTESRKRDFLQKVEQWKGEAVGYKPRSRD